MACNCARCGGKITGLAHIGIIVKDIEVSKAFYCETLGFFQLTGEYTLASGLRLAFVNAGDCRLELIQQPIYAPRTAGVVDHIAMEVEDIEPLVCKLVEKRIPFETGEIGTMPELLGGVKNIFFAGPDGERIEFFEYLNK